MTLMICGTITAAPAPCTQRAPISVALFTEQGEIIAGSERLLHLTATTQSFVFNDIAAEPVPSLLRNFSAPVYLDFDYTPPARRRSGQAVLSTPPAACC